ncbi:MAG: DMT family transporter [Brevirhabdus sp.]
MSNTRPAQAAGFMLLASVLIAGTTLVAKLLGGETLGAGLHPLQISHGRFLFAWLALAGVAAVLRSALTRPDLRLHAMRSLAGWGGVSLMFAAVTFIPLADATAISFLNPVFAMLLAIPLLGERVGKWRWLAAGIALSGGLVLLRPGEGALQAGALLALGAAVVLGLEITLVKRLAGREPLFQILLLANSFGLLFSSLAVIPVWVPPTAAQWGGMVALGLMMAIAQAMYVQSLRRADTSFAVPFSYATLVFAALYDFLIFDVVPGAATALGAGLIVMGALLLLWREGRVRREGRL